MAAHSLTAAETLELHVRVLESRGLPNRVTIGQMDPYVTLRVLATEQKTNVCKDGGVNPSWGYKTMLHATLGDTLHYAVFHQGMLGDVALGYGSIPSARPLSQIGDVTDLWLPLTLEGKASGELHLRMQLMRTGEVAIRREDMPTTQLVIKSLDGASESVTVIEPTMAMMPMPQPQRYDAQPLQQYAPQQQQQQQPPQQGQQGPMVQGYQVAPQQQQQQQYPPQQQQQQYPQQQQQQQQQYPPQQMQQFPPQQQQYSQQQYPPQQQQYPQQQMQQQYPPQQQMQPQQYAPVGK